MSSRLRWCALAPLLTSVAALRPAEELHGDGSKKSFLVNKSPCASSGYTAHVAEMCNFVWSKGYPFEAHWAETEDGVRLQLFRLPQQSGDAPLVHLQHGIFDSAWAWVFNPSFTPPAFYLHDKGYDVWLGNNRGSGFCETWANGTSASKDASYWDFSVDELGRYDVPAMMRKELSETGHTSLVYIGHSQGFMQFVTSAVHPSEQALQVEISKNVSLLVGFSPVVFLSNSRPKVRTLMHNELVMGLLRKAFPLGIRRDENTRIITLLCNTPLFDQVCKFGFKEIIGVSAKDDLNNVAKFSQYFPYGTSMKDLDHMRQMMRQGTFRRFDYGAKLNTEKYGQDTPPDYDLSTFAVPTALFFAEHDGLVMPEDANRLVKSWPQKELVHQKKYAGFSHVTWTLGGQGAKHYLDDLAELLQKHVGPSSDSMSSAAAAPEGDKGEAPASG